jgi:hypothetical protein
MSEDDGVDEHYQVTGVRFYGPDARSRRRRDRDVKLIKRAKVLRSDLQRDPINTAQAINDGFRFAMAAGVIYGLIGGALSTLLVEWMVR